MRDVENSTYFCMVEGSSGGAGLLTIEGIITLLLNACMVCHEQYYFVRLLINCFLSRSR